VREGIRLLVTAPHYRYFIKGLVEATAPHVSEVTVLVRYNPLSELGRRIPLPYFRHVGRYSRAGLLDLAGKPGNVGVHLVPRPYVVPDGRNKKLGDKLFVSFRDYIREKGIEFDLIHAHFIWSAGYVGARLKEEFGTPLIITAHGYDVYDLPFRDGGWFERVEYALGAADHVITVSRRNGEILRERLKVPAGRISVIPNGFDSRLFRPMNRETVRKKLGLPQDRRVLLNVANLVPVKGHEHLILAMGEVVKHRGDVLLVIVGDGPKRRALEKLARRMGLEHYVWFVGRRPHKEVPLWMNAADLFLLPSLDEGNPTVMFEALGVGLPFVGTAVGGVPEVITSEDYGLLCPPGDSDCLAEKILIGLERDWNRERIVEYGGQFTWDRVAGQVLEVYKKVLVDFKTEPFREGI